MASYINGVNGSFQGKIGEVVGATWKGIPYMRALPTRRSGPVSEKENINRKKWALSQQWLKPVLNFVREGFKGYSATVEGFVAAKSYLLKNAIEATGADFVINPALVKVSFGNLPLPVQISATKTANDQVQFTWSTENNEGAHSNDQVMMLAYNIDKLQARIEIAGQLRKTGSDFLKIDASQSGTWHLYAAFVASDRSRQSDSVYLGTIQIN
jgi:hypothetical protein